MKITCVGGGPAGLYFAVCAMRRDAGHEITVVERDPRGSTYGWGVGYWDDLLDVMYSHDRASAVQVRQASTVWHGREIRLPGERPVHASGFGYTVNRSTLLDILTARAEELGVRVVHESRLDESAAFPEADLVVASDGSGSIVRSRGAEVFQPSVRRGRNRYIWLGTTRRFRKMTFAFAHTDAGWLWFYGYPSAPGISTCVVECPPETHTALGLDSLDRESGLALLEQLFAEHLGGHRLISSDRGEAARWSSYREVSNRHWWHDNVVLLGDAAHTAHFTMGSGTGLAMMDAAELADSLYQRSTLPKALARYERRRMSAVRRVQASGRSSMAWFEQPERHLVGGAVEVAYALTSRYQPERPWQHAGHLAHQLRVVRAAERVSGAATRRFRAVRRGDTA